MHWNSIANGDRLRLWKKLRTDISGMDKHRKLEAVATFCATIPFGPRTIDYYSSEEWPTPWEILCNGSFCLSSISLLMYYTLQLVDVPADLILVEDDDGVYLLPIIDDTFVLNYESGFVDELDDIHEDFDVKQRYTPSQIKNVR